MTSATPVTAANSLSALANTATTTQVGAGANDSNMNEFLTLLTAQLKNQDPTNPTDPTQFVSQLAQFSTVEQLTQSNTTLDTISSSLSGLALGQYSSMVNQTVTSNASAVDVPASAKAAVDAVLLAFASPRPQAVGHPAGRRTVARVRRKPPARRRPSAVGFSCDPRRLAHTRILSRGFRRVALAKSPRHSTKHLH